MYMLHCSEVDSYQDAWYECEKFGHHLIHFKVIKLWEVELSSVALPLLS